MDLTNIIEGNISNRKVSCYIHHFKRGPISDFTITRQIYIRDACMVINCYKLKKGRQVKKGEERDACMIISL